MHNSIKKWSVLAAALALIVVVLSACAATPPETTDGGTDGQAAADLQATIDALGEQVGLPGAEETIAALQTQAAVEPTEAVATQEVVDRTGGWFDTIVVSEEPNPDAAVQRLISGDIDIYSYGVSDPEVYNRVVESEELEFVNFYGSYNELTFNTVEFANGEMNPFTSAAIREAMNWLIDRNHISQEIYQGLSVPKYVTVNSASPDYALYADIIRAVEAKYAYNPDRANEVITAEMEAMGAELVDGKWNFNGEPVTLIFLIRTEDRRRDIGDYVSNQLETVGFTVDRQYKRSSEAAPCWIGTEPSEGCFHLYTGGWASTAISRDDGTNFGFFYLPVGALGPLWGGYDTSDEFEEAAMALWNNDFASMEERRELFETALTLGNEESIRVWIVDQASITPYRTDLEVSANLSAGVAGNSLWPWTMRREGEVGGSLQMAMQSILTQAWNPVGGSNWVYDAALQRATGELAVITDPFTGLGLPNRVERAEVTVKEGLPVRQSLDWVALDFAAEIPVPEDAWADFNAETQTFITVGEKFPEGTTANLKSVVYYPEDLFTTVTWHDGSPISVGDFVLAMIVSNGLDIGQEASPNYDPALTPVRDAFLAAFKGVKIVSTDPLVIETYTDAYQLDAELAVFTWWPYYSYGQAPWHTLGLGLRADAANLAAFSPDKAAENEVEHLNYISGPTVEVLATQLTEATAESFLPYAPTMSEYVSADEITLRYTNLAEFYRVRGHFWVNTGPYFLQRAFPVEGTVILEHYGAHPDSSDRWAGFGAAPVPDVLLDGPSEVAIGEEASYTVDVTFEGAPYAAEDIERVFYLVFDAEGNLATQGDATGGENGLWNITLTADQTSALAEGSNRIEVVVVSNRVALPVFASQEFVTTQ